MSEWIVKQKQDGQLKVVGELIRCKDCKYNRTIKCPMRVESYTSGYGYCVDIRNEPDDFCSLAERKEE